MPTTSSPSSPKYVTDSDPIRPVDPVITAALNPRLPLHRRSPARRRRGRPRTVGRLPPARSCGGRTPTRGHRAARARRCPGRISRRALGNASGSAASTTQPAPDSRTIRAISELRLTLASTGTPRDIRFISFDGRLNSSTSGRWGTSPIVARSSSDSRSSSSRPGISTRSDRISAATARASSPVPGENQREPHRRARARARMPGPAREGSGRTPYSPCKAPGRGRCRSPNRARSPRSRV